MYLFKRKVAEAIQQIKNEMLRSTFDNLTQHGGAALLVACVLGRTRKDLRPGALKLVGTERLQQIHEQMESQKVRVDSHINAFDLGWLARPVA